MRTFLNLTVLITLAAAILGGHAPATGAPRLAAALRLALAATTVTVNLATDISDASPGDGFCDASLSLLGDQCTLRAAIEELNALGAAANPHKIHFNIPGSGPFTLMPASQYPLITVPVEIDATTQPGATCPTADAPANLMIIINGASSGFDTKGLFLHLGSDGSLIRGLVIGNFSNSGISITSDDNRIDCNHLGIGADGITEMGNEYLGINVMGDNNTIGGQGSHARRNVISSNNDRIDSMGINIAGDDNIVRNNYVGTTASGDNDARNDIGIQLEGDNNTIGGAAPLARNIISGNVYGLKLLGSDNIILGNEIGVAADGVSELRNTIVGIEISSYASGNLIGGTGAGEGNHVAYQLGNGISTSFLTSVSDPVFNTIRGNRIHDNYFLGIDLEDDGVTTNDLYDSDTGANGLQNYPILNETPGSVVITGTLNTQALATYDIDVYRSQSCDVTGYGEGQFYLESVQVTTNNLGFTAFSIDLSGRVAVGSAITATATDPNGNTSEFSPCVYVGPAAGMTFTVTHQSDHIDTAPGDYHCDAYDHLSGDQCTLRAAIEEINALGAGTTRHRIAFDLSTVASRIEVSIMPLPAIQVPVVIDGATQTDAACPTADSPAALKVVVDGAKALTLANGLVLDPGSDGSTIRGMVITNFGGTGVVMNSSNNILTCSHVGLDADGITAAGNLTGVSVTGENNWIGGHDLPFQRNVISGNLGTGIALRDTAVNNSIFFNLIGTTADGLAALGNQMGGVYISGTNNYLGYSNENIPGSIISGNNLYGVQIDGGDDNLLLSNQIGVARDGVTPLPNTGNGIEIRGDAVGNRIGDPGAIVGQRAASSPWFRNVIANNSGYGVAMMNANGAFPGQNLLHANRIYDNGGLGIDLGTNGVDTNDPTDADSGSNAAQNYPILGWINGTDLLNVTLSSQPNTQYTLEFFSSPACDSSGYGEGAEYLDSAQVTTDAAGMAAVELDLAGQVPAGAVLTATATDPGGNTSEFSACAAQLTVIDDYPLFIPSVTR